MRIQNPDPPPDGVRPRACFDVVGMYFPRVARLRRNACGFNAQPGFGRQLIHEKRCVSLPVGGLFGLEGCNERTARDGNKDNSRQQSDQDFEKSKTDFHS